MSGREIDEVVVREQPQFDERMRVPEAPQPRHIIAVLWSPSREPLVLAVFHTREVADAKPDDAVIAGAARIVAETFGRF
ncbi:hypothetical protein C7405_10135 [Paraburkholderia caballeronis]|nr:hypothetical protein C7405_10135 [Paraburkholderia caballeronis]